MIAILAGLVTLAFIAALISLRERRTRRFRVGMFVEREVDPEDQPQPPPPKEE